MLLYIKYKDSLVRYNKFEEIITRSVKLLHSLEKTITQTKQTKATCSIGLYEFG